MGLTLKAVCPSASTQDRHSTFIPDNQYKGYIHVHVFTAAVVFGDLKGFNGYVVFLHVFTTPKLWWLERKGCAICTIPLQTLKFELFFFF